MQAYTLTHHLTFSGKGHLSLPIQCKSQAKLKILGYMRAILSMEKNYSNFVSKFTSNLLISTLQI